MGKDLERTLKLFCRGSFEDEFFQNYFYRLGKVFYHTQIEKYKNEEKPKDSALTDMIDYLIFTRDKLFSRKDYYLFDFFEEVYENYN